MKKKSLHPKSWRKALGFSMATVARSLGIEGSNPSRTWQRYENGEREPPIALVSRVEDMSNGQVNSHSWANVRESYLSKQEALS